MRHFVPIMVAAAWLVIGAQAGFWYARLSNTPVLPALEVHIEAPAAPNFEPIRIPYPICFGKTIRGDSTIIRDTYFDDSPLVIIGNNTTVISSSFTGGRWGIYAVGSGSLINNSVIANARHIGISMGAAPMTATTCPVGNTCIDGTASIRIPSLPSMPRECIGPVRSVDMWTGKGGCHIQ